MSKFADYVITFGIGVVIVVIAKSFIGDLYTATDHIIVNTAIVLWFAVGYYLNLKLKEVHEKLDRIIEMQSKIDNPEWRDEWTDKC